MQRRSSILAIVFLAIVLAITAYLLGKKNGTKTIDSMVNNEVLIKDIAELASLEVQGNASIKSSNISNDGSFTDAMKKLFMERTVNITVPYVAKYGVNLDKQQVHIQQKDKIVLIVLPTPQLLSYELRIDKADASTKKGLFQPENEAGYANIEKKLYTQSRGQMETKQAYIQQAKTKLITLLQNYYAPMNLKVDVSFSDDLKSKLIIDSLQ